MQNGRIEFSDNKYEKSREKLQPYKRKMVDLVSPTRAGKVMDIGCGTGVVSQILKRKGWDVTGLDISYLGVKKYRCSGFTGIVANIEHGLPFENDTFEAVWISEVMEHIVEYQKLISEIKRVLKPNGRLYLTTPNSAFWGYRLMYIIGKCPSELQHPYHLRFFNSIFLCKVLDDNGFNIERNLGQNIYMMLPSSFINRVIKFNRFVGFGIKKVIKSMGFRETEGLIHGNKYLIYFFSSTLTNIFSNVVMIVAQKRCS